VIGPQGPVPREEIARRLILLLQRVGRLHAGEPAEVVLGQNPDPFRFARLGVELLGFPELLAPVDRSEPLGADDEHRRLRVDVVGSGAAELRDERERVLAAERAQFSGEDDKVSCERLCVR